MDARRRSSKEEEKSKREGEREREKERERDRQKDRQTDRQRERETSALQKKGPRRAFVPGKDSRQPWLGCEVMIAAQVTLFYRQGRVKQWIRVLGEALCRRREKKSHVSERAYHYPPPPPPPPPPHSADAENTLRG